MGKKKNRKIFRDLKRGLVTFTNPKSPISEQYRTIRTNIQFSMIDKRLRTLVCTSAMPGEGKSTTISNLAVTFAQQGKRTLLVDADLRRPTLHHLMEVNNQVGLTSLLTKRCSLKDAIIENTKENGLHVLPSGPIPPNPSEMLSSNMMEELILELLSIYDMILFDSPPVLAVTDSLILGKYCEGVLLVLRPHQTEKKDLLKAKELLDRSNAKLLGVIMNDVHANQVAYHSYYGNQKD